MQFIFLRHAQNGRHTTTNTQNSDVAACCVLLFAKHEVHCCDFLNSF